MEQHRNANVQQDGVVHFVQIRLINVKDNHVTTVEHVNLDQDGFDASVLKDSPVRIAELMLTNAHRNRVWVVQHVKMESEDLPVFVL